MKELTVQEVRQNRMKEKHTEQVVSLEKQIRYIRKRIVNEDKESIIDTILLPELKRKKEELFKLRGEWQDEFTHSKSKVKEVDGHYYVVEAKFGASTMQETIVKTDGRWWSAGCRVESTDHRKVESAILEVFKNYWGLK